ncbi:hypothetical protein GCM10010330_79860 [Streptomyces tendae]|uniref:hypothetical protein n=1 Tax=Streptomyces tendae TaxID=1932 RepID=UPI00167BC990|nr:hypothetical protein [Streptomyces tendae]GHB14111.1 hypothetical protein GCM10010330_79860 [Streptomyces tendae]
MALTAAVTAWLKGELGTTVDLADLEARYTRLGTARAVALEVLRERLAALRAQPSSVNVSGVVSVTFAENIKAYERQITALENGDPPAPDVPTDDSGGRDGIGLITLHARPRR